MAETKNSAPPESIKEENDSLPVLRTDLISIPLLCAVLAAKHGAMTEVESWEIMGKKFRQTRPFSFGLYFMPLSALPLLIVGITLSIWYDLEESDNQSTTVLKAMREFINEIFFSNWAEYDPATDDPADYFYSSDLSTLKTLPYNTANDIGILKSEASKFGVTEKDIDDYNRNQLARVYSFWDDTPIESEQSISAYAGTMPDLNKPDRLDPRKETTYLNVIGAMLHILLNPPRDDKGNLKNINTQAAVIDEIVDLFGHKQGISERTLQDKFSAAKKSLDNS